MFMGVLKFKCSAQKFLRDLTSSSSYSVLVSVIFVSSPRSLVLFWLPSLVRARVFQACTGAPVSVCPGWGIWPPQLTQGLHELPPWLCYESLCQHLFSGSHSQFTPGSSLLPQQLPSERYGLWIYLCYAICLKRCTFRCSVDTLASPPPFWGSPLFWGPELQPNLLHTGLLEFYFRGDMCIHFSWFNTESLDTMVNVC